MAYLGNTPAARFSSMQYQDLTSVTGSPTAKRDFTLNHSVGSANEIEVFVNNVRQEPSVAYTVSGTLLSMTGDVETTDDFYVVFQGLAQQTATHPSSSALEATTGTFSSNVDVGGSLLVDTIKEGTGTNTAMTIASSGIITNATPVGFVVDVQSNQSGFTDNAYTKVPFQLGGTFTFDTHSGWSNANSYYTVPTGCGGYWFLNVFIELDVTAQTGAAIITKTATAGSFNNAIARGYVSENTTTTNNPTIGIQTVANLSDGEIIKAELFHNYGSSRSVIGNTVALVTSFQGWRLF